MSTHSLSRTVAGLCQPVVPLELSSSIQRAAEALRETGLPAIPVVDAGHLIGTVEGRVLSRALASGFDPTAPLCNLPLSELPTLRASATGAEALRTFELNPSVAILVVDAHLHLVGVLAPAHLYPYSGARTRLPLVGGMATPVGVYLTTGGNSGGVRWPALLLAGALMGALHFVATLVSDGLGQAMVASPLDIPLSQVRGIVAGLSVVFFLALIRLHPLSGYHAAEHMVVHAVERGEPLIPEIVARMPRVHPRCGTNLAAAMGLFFGIGFTPWIPWEDARLLVALLVTLVFWRAFGTFLQENLTTRRPTRKQIEAGIRAAKDLIQSYEESPVVAPTGWQRMWNSGMLGVLMGYLSTVLFLESLAGWLNLGGVFRVL